MVVGDALAGGVEQIPAHHSVVDKGYTSVKRICLIEIVGDKSRTPAVDKGPSHHFVFDKGVAVVEIIDILVVVGDFLSGLVYEAPAHDFVFGGGRSLAVGSYHGVVIADAVAVEV